MTGTLLKKILGRTFLVVFGLVFAYANIAQAAFNEYINYQGKLTDSTNVAVPDDDYNMEFKLYDDPSAGNLLWTETRTDGDMVEVRNGLFSVLLGEVTALSGIDFNQPLYLSVNIGGTDSPSWDGEMTPRKQLSTVPTALLAKTSLTSDVADTALALDAVNATSANATTTNFYVTNFTLGSDTVTDLTGTGLIISGGALTVSTSSLANLNSDLLDSLDSTQFLRSDASDSYTSGTLTFDAGTVIDFNSTSISFADTDITFDGASINFDTTGDFSINTSMFFIEESTGYVGIGIDSDLDDALTVAGDVLITTTSDSGLTLFYEDNGAVVFRAGANGGLFYGVSGYPVSTVLTLSKSGGHGGNYLQALDSNDDAVFVINPNGDVGIASSTLFAKLTITNEGSAPSFIVEDEAGDTSPFVIDASGNVGIGTTSPWKSLSISGDMVLTGALFDGSASAGTNGYVLQTTGSGVQWVATSSLGFPTASIGAGTTGQIPYYAANGSALTATSVLNIKSAGQVVIGGSLSGPSPIGLHVLNKSGLDENTIFATSDYSYFAAGSSLTVSFDSTTQSPVLNANSFGSLLENNLILQSVAGNVGIGTTTPNSKLVIVDGDNTFSFNKGGGDITPNISLGTSGGKSLALLAGASGTTFTFDGSGFFSIASDTKADIDGGSSDGGALLLTVLGNGNVGIGNSSPTEKLHVETDDFDGYAIRAVNLNGDGGGAKSAIIGQTIGVGEATGVAGYLGGYDGTSLWYGVLGTSGNSKGIAVYGFAEDGGVAGAFMGGNVGIGTTSPWKDLSVLGDFSLTGALFDSSASAGTNGMVLQTTGSGTQWVATSSLGLGSGTVGVGTTGQFPFYAANGTTLTATSSININSAGQISIGATTATPHPDTSLHVLNRAGSSVNTVFATNDYEYFVDGGALVLYFDGSDNPALYAAGAGGFGAASLSLQTSTGGNLAVGFGVPTAKLTVIQDDYFSNRSFMVLDEMGDTSPFLIDGDGNVGIGSTTINHKLDVYGDINTDDRYYIGGQQALYIPGYSSDDFAGSMFVGNGGQNLSHIGGTMGWYNVGIGGNSLYDVTTGAGNIGIGEVALASTTVGVGNVAIGVGALTSSTSSVYNIAIGLYAGAGSAGSNNILIGNIVNTPSTYSNYALNIGDAIYGNLNTGVKTIGIGSTTPYAKLTVTNIGSMPSFVVEDSASDSTPFLIDASGNVGIGTTSPWKSLSVSGDMVLTGALFDGSASAGTNGYVLQTTGSGVQWVATSSLGLGIVGSGTIGQIPYFAANGSALTATSSLFLSTNENVGIGSTTPSAKLTVRNLGSSNSFLVEDEAGDTSPFLIDASGNVGIGITAPGSKLHVVGLSNAIKSTVSTSGGAIMQGILDTANSFARAVFSHNASWDATNDLWEVQNIGANDTTAILMPNGGGIQFITHPSTGSTDRTFSHTDFLAGVKVTLTAAGRFGVGITSPTSIFHASSTGSVVTGIFNQTGTGNILELHDSGSTVFSAIDGGFIGASAFAPRSKFAVHQVSTTSLNNLRQNVENTGITIDTDYIQNAYTPGIFWTTRTNNSTKTKSGIWTINTSTGSYLYFGTSNNYATGVNNVALTINPTGNIGVGTTSPWKTLSVTGSLSVTGGFFDTSASGGVNGYVLSSTGSGTQWIATSSLGLGGGGGSGTVGSGTTGQIPYYAANGTTLTATSTLTISSASHVIVGGGTDAIISRNDTSSGLGIYGGTGIFDGAYFNITGDDYTDSPGGSSAEFVIGGNSDSKFSLFTRDGGWTERFRVNGSTGYVNIAQRLMVGGLISDTPDTILAVDGDISSTDLLGGATTLSTDANGVIIRTPSDQKLKRNIAPIENALDKVLQMNGVTYYWKDTERFGSGREIGLIAQQIESIVPEVVKSGGEYKSVNYQVLTALLIEAIKEQQLQINTLENTLLSADTISNFVGDFVSHIGEHLLPSEGNESAFVNMVSGIAESLTEFIGIDMGNLGDFTGRLVTAMRLVAYETFTSSFTILPQGTLALPQGKNEMIGYAIIPEGETSVFIENTRADNSARIFLTPITPILNPLYVSEVRPGEGFEVSVGAAQLNDIGFDWLMVFTYGETNRPNVESTSLPLVRPDPVSGDQNSDSQNNSDDQSGGNNDSEDGVAEEENVDDEEDIVNETVQDNTGESGDTTGSDSESSSSTTSDDSSSASGTNSSNSGAPSESSSNSSSGSSSDSSTSSSGVSSGSSDAGSGGGSDGSSSGSGDSGGSSSAPDA